MIEINKDNFEQEVLKSDKPVVVEFFRPVGCINCEKMKPVMEQFEKANPDIKVVIYTCGNQPDEITKKYQFKMFPGIFAFANGKVVRAYSGVKSLNQMATIFMSLSDLKAAIYDKMMIFEKAQRNLTFLQSEIDGFNSGIRIVGEKEPVEEVKEEEFGEPETGASDEEKTAE